MSPEEFLETARTEISDNPISRLSPRVQAVLERDNFVMDTHVHAFDAQCINLKYFLVRTLGDMSFGLTNVALFLLSGKRVGKMFRSYDDEDFLEEVYENDLNALIKSQSVDEVMDQCERCARDVLVEMAEKNRGEDIEKTKFVQRYLDIIRILKEKKMAAVYGYYDAFYAINRIFNALYNRNTEQISVVLGMDLELGWNAEIKKSYAQQAEELGQLTGDFNVIPFLPIDPRRADIQGEQNLYVNFLKAFHKDSGLFYGLKCYPALGFHPNDSRLQPIWEICNEKKIPVLTHCGGETVSTFQNPVYVNNRGRTEKVKGLRRKARARYLNEPERWKEVLQNHPNIHINFGHFGGTKAWTRKRSVYTDRRKTLLGMMRKYPVYADFSFNLDSPEATDALVSAMLENNTGGRLLQNRVLFGTDFWVILPVSDLNIDQAYFLEKIGPLHQKILKENTMKFLGIDRRGAVV